MKRGYGTICQIHLTRVNLGKMDIFHYLYRILSTDLFWSLFQFKKSSFPKGGLVQTHIDKHMLQTVQESFSEWIWIIKKNRANLLYIVLTWT
jgi:hypothetical protein